MTRPITINLLGPFEARDVRGNLLAVRSRRARALLACLAMDAGESWTRTRLATLLWGRSEQQGRSSLRQELVQLRKNLCVTAPGDWGDESVVRLPEQISTDVTLFRSALSRGDAPEAASIWRGELLQGEASTRGPFADWLALCRSKLRQQASECFAKTLRASEQGDDPLRLEGVALKLIALDPASEDGHRCLMRCAASRRDVAAVIDRYREYVASLDAGADGEPSAAMKGLLDEAIAAAASRVGVATTVVESTGWINEINCQHHTAAAPQPQRLLPIENAASLAVVPFLDLSPGAASWTALADGLTEETTTAMARIPGLFVTARQSCMVYKNTVLNAQTIAQGLGVRYLVEGSIEVRGKSLRVHARLVDGPTGFHIWANSYEEQLRDFFAVRNRIVTAIASQLQPALSAAEIERALNAGPNNLDAWTRLQRAHAHVLFKRSAQGLASAISLRMMERAMRISPRDPRSHRWFHYAGWCHWKLGELDKMEEAARNAIELYSDAPAQWVELTCALGLQGKIAEAREAAKVLKKLSPVFTPDGFYEIARRFYGSRFAGPVQADYRALCSTLQRAT